MTLSIVQGDIRKTAAQAIFLGLNVHGQVEVTPLETALRDQYPVFFSEYRRMGRGGTLIPGQLWYFRDATPWLVGMIIKESAHSPARLRHLEQVLITLRRDWQRESLTSIAMARFGDEIEWNPLRVLLEEYLSSLPLPIILYENFIPDQQVQEPISTEP